MFLRLGQKFSKCLLLSDITINLIRKQNIPFILYDKSYSTKFLFDNNNSKTQYQEIEDLLSKFNSIPNSSEWSNIYEAILNKKKFVNNSNIDAIILGSCKDNLNLAKSYISYLITNNKKPNYATIGKLLKIYNTYYEDRNVPAEENQAILEWCDKLLKLGLLDFTTADNVIHGLVLTKRWKECLKMINMIKFTSKPKALTYSIVIKTAFANDEADIGWKLLLEMIELQRQPYCLVYESWINYCLRKYHLNNNKDILLSDLEKMLNLIGNSDIRISLFAGNKFLDAFEKLGWEGNVTTVIGANCNCCKTKLPPIKVLVKDFKKLQEEFIQRVLIRNDVFVRSNPIEIKNFRDMIEKTMPYDVVIDGLNVAFGTGKKNYIEMANGLLNVVQHFVDLGKTIMVLGRKHMNKWPQKQMRYIRSKAHMFLTDDLSYDDPFLLQAAIGSGPKTIIVSRDLMRSHKFLLKDPVLRETFTKWQLSKQYQVQTYRKDGTIVFLPPLKYLPTAQKINKTWHIPIVEEFNPNPPNSLDPPAQWICIRNKS